MLRAFIRRLTSAGIVMLALVAVAFLLLRLVPGGPYNPNPRTTPEILSKLALAFHRDEPIYAQFGRYLWGVLHLDFGPSTAFREYDASAILFLGAPITVQIIAWSLIGALVIGIPLGSIAARRPGAVIDNGLLVLGMIGLAVPVSVGAMALTFVFALLLHWLPVGGWDGGWAHGVLPCMALTVPLAAAVTQLTRRFLADRASTAGGGAKALTRGQLLASLAHVLSGFGSLTAIAVLGSILVERVFSLPGTGRYLMQALSVADFAVVAGTLVFYSAIVVLAGLLGDLGCLLIERRSGITTRARSPMAAPALPAPIWPVLRRDRSVMITACAVIAMGLCCWLLPLVLHFGPDDMDYYATAAAPSWTSGHLLGTDELGRDLLVSLLIGARITLLFGLAPALVAAAILSARLVAGRLFPRFALGDIWVAGGLLNTLPILILAGVVEAKILADPLANLVLPAITTWFLFKAIRHPRTPILFATIVAIPYLMTTEVYLALFGVRVQEPFVSLGSLIAGAGQDMEFTPWVMIAPVVALVIAAACVGFIGERIGDVVRVRIIAA